MAYDGSGVFKRLYSWVADATAGLDILADRMDIEMDGFATGLSNCLTRDGQAGMVAAIDMNGHKIIDLADPTNDQDAVTKKFAEGLIQGQIPSGGIIMWAGTIAAVPAGWKLCDGNNGTPNLTDRFVIGAGAAYAVGVTGGKFAITEVPAHDHDLGTVAVTSGGAHTHVQQVDGVDQDRANAVGNMVSGTNVGNGLRASTVSTQSGGAHTHPLTGKVASAGVASVDITPPYYALAYIMKV